MREKKEKKKSQQLWPPIPRDPDKRKKKKKKKRERKSHPKTHFHILNNITYIFIHFFTTRISKIPKQYYSNSFIK